MPNEAQFVTYVVGDSVFSFQPISSEHELRIELELKQQFRTAEERIREWQKTNKQDGYILMNNVVYCAYKDNTITKKITGDVAKQVKRKIKVSKMVTH